MQHTGLNCMDCATVLTPVLLEVHGNPPIQKSKFILGKKKRFTKAELPFVQDTHILLKTVSCSPSLAQRKLHRKNT